MDAYKTAHAVLTIAACVTFAGVVFITLASYLTAGLQTRGPGQRGRYAIIIGAQLCAGVMAILLLSFGEVRNMVYLVLTLESLESPPAYSFIVVVVANALLPVYTGFALRDVHRRPTISYTGMGGRPQWYTPSRAPRIRSGR